jgi:hypothetical protein
MGFKKASKKQSKLRCAVFGPSGAGKTYTSLRIAKGMGGSIGAIDTEHGAMSKYADRFEFDVLELKDKSIDGYIGAINDAASAGFDNLIIDSLSHGWQELMEAVDKLAKTKYKGNTWSAWSDGTPQQKKLIEAILTYPGHIFATMRSKTDWTTEKTRDGKNRPVRLGLAPEQGKGIEYEFDMLFEIDADHMCTIIKDRTGKFQDKIIEKPGEEFGEELYAWLNEGEAAKVETELPEDNTATDDTSSTSNYIEYEVGSKTRFIVSEDEALAGDLDKAYDFLGEDKFWGVVTKTGWKHLDILDQIASQTLLVELRKAL